MNADHIMRQALSLFAVDPPDSDFQQGYLCALLVFANEGLGFAWNDPSLAQCEPALTEKSAAALARKRFEVIDGGKP